jgi:hypothetical protein
MAKDTNLENGTITVTGVPKKLKSAIKLLAGEDFVDVSTYVRNLLKRDVQNRGDELAKLQ